MVFVIFVSFVIRPWAREHPLSRRLAQLESMNSPTEGTIGSIESNGFDVVRVATFTPGGMKRTLSRFSTLTISAKSVSRRRDQLNARFARRSSRL